MFCPKCGKADQTPETYCRQCGNYLHDYNKIAKKETSPEEHLTVNSVLSAMSAIVSLTLAILLHTFFWGKANTPILIYITAGFLTAMFFWQAQTFWRNILLRKHFKKQKNHAQSVSEKQSETPTFESKPTNELLPEANFENFVPPSVVENTTKHLNKVKREK